MERVVQKVVLYMYSQQIDNKIPYMMTSCLNPTKHCISAYSVSFLLQETMNMLCFFDEATGTWLPMPLAWERHVPAISNMTSKIQVVQQGGKTCGQSRV